MEIAYQGKHPPAKLFTMAYAPSQSLQSNDCWVPDTGCTDHVTPNLGNLTL